MQANRAAGPLVSASVTPVPPSRAALRRPRPLHLLRRAPFVPGRRGSAGELPFRSGVEWACGHCWRVFCFSQMRWQY
ncbi:hypothetical protein GQ55_2G041300 [Panicum hallii var. hallii]|uniref:Uncharacterized protein n=1 Tax=Panicum hallii var. hallii TaxID=1504633 RepID=A0A2T7EL91_9POAL|nr:hypothetical protein GQ55_2G041300 [Panicum hallii var. hallii]